MKRDIHTLTEGVETREQYEFLKSIGCEKIQGYYFGKPKPVEEFTRQIDCSFDTNEDPDFKDYYDTIGMINFLSSVPLRPSTRTVYNNLAIAIIEIDEETDEFEYLFANEAYHKMFSSINAKSLDEIKKMHVNDKAANRLILDVIKMAEEAGTERISFDYAINGHVFSSRVRFIARQGRKAAFGFVAREKS